MEEFNVATEFDNNYIERPINLDDMKKSFQANLNKLNQILEKDKFATGKEIINLKIILGQHSLYLNQLDVAEGYLSSSQEEAKLDKLANELFTVKMYLGILFYKQNKAYKCDENLQKCAEVAQKKTVFKSYLPKIQIYQSLNKKAQREKSKQHSYAQSAINSCIDNGNVELMEVAKKLLAD